MRTTLNIDDQLYREVKIRAAVENRTVTELVEIALRGLLGETSKEAVKARPKKSKGTEFPTVKTRKRHGVRRNAISIEEMGERLKEAELESDIERHEKVFGH